LGLIKVLQCGRNGQIVASRFADEPTTDIDWDTAGLRIPSVTQEWPARHGHRLAAVSSFGVSGTNTHLIVDMPEANRA
ncbi:MAG: polyketide synthase, partial [Gordonia sp. (in: high G+C Gram-positive bacteria)]